MLNETDDDAENNEASNANSDHNEKQTKTSSVTPKKQDANSNEQSPQQIM